MLEWLSNNWGGLIVGIVLVAILTAITVGLIKNKKKGKSSCGCNCSACALCNKCHTQTETPPKR